MDTQDKYSDEHKNYSKQGTGEGDPGNIDPDEIDRVSPSKSISESETLERNESGFGIKQSLKVSTENLDLGITQIDDETKEMQQQNKQSESMDETMRKEFDTDDFNRVDERDREDSTKDWDAEQSRTGRNK